VVDMESTSPANHPLTPSLTKEGNYFEHFHAQRRGGRSWNLRSESTLRLPASGRPSRPFRLSMCNALPEQPGG
jgi:hypothetical protein